jgi:hypothetical protein
VFGAQSDSVVVVGSVVDSVIGAGGVNWIGGVDGVVSGSVSVVEIAVAGGLIVASKMTLVLVALIIIVDVGGGLAIPKHPRDRLSASFVI